MSTREPLIYPMPGGYELGMFVQQIAEHDEPRAIILDFLQKTVLVYPSAEDGTDSTEFTADSLAFLLTSVDLEHTDLPLDEALKKFCPDRTKVWVCAHPNLKDNFLYEGNTLWTKIVEPNYLLLAIQLSGQEWKVIGMSHNNPLRDT